MLSGKFSPRKRIHTLCLFSLLLVILQTTTSLSETYGKFLIASIAQVAELSAAQTPIIISNNREVSFIAKYLLHVIATLRFQNRMPTSADLILLALYVFVDLLPGRILWASSIVPVVVAKRTNLISTGRGSS